jgi:hypothetical protein
LSWKRSLKLISLNIVITPIIVVTTSAIRATIGD